MTADLTIRDEGSILLFTGTTEAGAEWLAESLDPDALTWGPAIVVEPRYAPDIIAGAMADGLTVVAS